MLVVHFNTPELTAQLIHDIPLKTPLGRQVFVHILDNCSTEENIDKLRRSVQAYSHVALEECRENIGFGRGMNYLAESRLIHGGDILWLLNSDTRVDPGCVGSLEKEIESERFGAISPLIYSGENDRIFVSYCGGVFRLPELLIEIPLYGYPVTDAPREPLETEFLTGTAPMMRASTFRAVGGFPTEYFLYWEDAYFSWKARKLGFRLGVVPSARIWHAVGASSGRGLSTTFYYWFARNRFTFASDMRITRRELVFGRGGMVSLRYIARAVTERQDRLAKIGAAIRGTLEGLRGPRGPSQ